MSLDYSRKFDLEELEELWKNAPNAFWRDQYEKQINKILKESKDPVLSKFREELIMAVRNNDRNHVFYIQNEINHYRQNQTGGREIS